MRSLRARIAGGIVADVVTDDAPIAHRIRRLRKQRGWRPERLAAEVEVTLRTVERWEGGHERPSATNAIKLARVLDEPVERFLPGGER